MIYNVEISEVEVNLVWIDHSFLLRFIHSFLIIFSIVQIILSILWCFTFYFGIFFRGLIEHDISGSIDVIINRNSREE